MSVEHERRGVKKEKQKLLSSEQKHILELDDVVKAYDMVKE